MIARMIPPRRKLRTPAMPVPMQKTRSIYLDRVERFTSLQHDQGATLTKSLIQHRNETRIKLRVHSVPITESPRPMFQDIISRQFREAFVGQTFGPSWSTHWFRVEVTVPEAMDGEKIYLYWRIDGEGLVYTPDGEPLQGLSSHPDRSEFLVADAAKAGQEHTFFIVRGFLLDALSLCRSLRATTCLATASASGRQTTTNFSDSSRSSCGCTTRR